MAKRATWLTPITLRVEYKPARPGAGGIMSQTATYVFKNEWPGHVKIAFPPIAYLVATEDSLTYDYYPDDVSRMPAFCRQPRVITFLPYEEKVFVEQAAWIQPDSKVRHRQEEFIFGNPLDLDGDVVLPCAVVGNVEEVSPGRPKTGE
jgi:hypothetical protein